MDTDQINRRIHIPKSSLYRYLSTLCHESILEYDPAQKKYRIGPFLMKLKLTVVEQDGLMKIAEPLMSRLVQEKNETAFLTAVKGDEAVCIERIESKNSIRFIINRGDSFPLHASATGRVLMAYLPEKDQERIIAKGLPKVTPNTITDPAKLEKILSQVRKNGFAFSDQELNPGGKAIAAPIFNSLGQVVAGLGIAAPTYRFTRGKMKEYKKAILHYALEISSRMGYRP